MKKIVPLVIVIFFLASCGDSSIFSGKPKNVLSKKQMVSLLMDMQLTEMKFQNMSISPRGLDTLRNIYRYGYVALFKKHKVTPDQFQVSMEYYTKRPDVMNDIYDEVITNITEMESALHGKKEAPSKTSPGHGLKKTIPDSTDASLVR